MLLHSENSICALILFMCLQNVYTLQIMHVYDIEDVIQYNR